MPIENLIDYKLSPTFTGFWIFLEKSKKIMINLYKNRKIVTPKLDYNFEL